ncbi:MAG: hypothetical protein HZA51_17870 [Planctomycetes bacterium]|nr:hypothetical protein [Planctomycetota bacterium]
MFSLASFQRIASRHIDRAATIRLATVAGERSGEVFSSAPASHARKPSASAGVILRIGRVAVKYASRFRRVCP